MNKLILSIIYTIPLFAMAQQRDTSVFKAGTELIKYQKQHSAGTVLQLGGSILVGIGAASNGNTTTSTPLLIGGGVLSFIGFIMQLTATNHIRNAGILLRGNKLIMPIGR